MTRPTSHPLEHILAVSVVVPARNEARLIGRCLTAIRATVDHLRTTAAIAIDVDVTVVLDDCSDPTATIASAYDVRVVTVGYGAVGASRHAGVTAALRPDPRGLPRQKRLLWEFAHEPAPGHPHIYGANLGIRASTYLALGGFAPVATGEDRALVHVARDHGDGIVATDQAPVLTSARRHARAPHGFADWIHDRQGGML
ncbi:glycosyltransferase [Tsukamurella soli]|uniref:4,4'-diaponeurosporenoate glycosyltransferase n=1 Tax=Tsukamurella soli TaxID=644556 RepID=A0ABP8J5T8_9ACTN